MSIEKIIVISNSRMFFLTLLLLNNVSISSVFFIFDSSIPYEYVRNIPFFMKVKRANGYVSLIVYFIRFLVSYLFFQYKYKLYKLPIYGADHIMGAKYLLRRHKFYLIEDGTANYSKESYICSWKNKLFSVPSFGMYHTVKKIYLTKKVGNDIPIIVRKKIEVIDIKKLWGNLDNENKEFIFELFGLDKDKINSIRNKKYILFTQPLSEDRIISEEEKIKIYLNIIRKYGEDNLIIKMHPREKTDYSRFTQAFVFPKEVPSELLVLLNIEFDRVVTLFSSAVLDYPKDKIDFYGTAIHPAVHKRFGNISI